ncbi:MAG: Protein-export membrane protein SecF, partial [Mesotoga infera]
MTFKADFVGKRKYFTVLSLVLIVVSIVFIFTKGFNFGVDFTGGIEISVSVPDVDKTVAEMRELLSAEDPSFAAARIIKQRPLIEEGSSEQRSRFSVIVNASESEQWVTDKILAGLESEGVSESNILSVSTISGYAAQEIRGYAWIA